MTRDDIGDDDRPPNLSRRDLLKRAGIVGAAAVVAPILVSRPDVAQAAQSATYETLTTPEAETLEAVVARLIPTDENGPGAREARAATYIDRALGGALASSRDAYRSGLAAVDAYARTTKGARFSQLTAADQDAVLGDLERNVAPGFTPGSAAFFSLLRAHTLQGTFGDPYYGGNANFVGWDLIGYPGIRLAVTADDQALDPKLTPTHRSAYDHAMFSNKPPRARLEKGLRHGD